jgi:hypothetical protein
MHKLNCIVRIKIEVTENKMVINNVNSYPELTLNSLALNFDVLDLYNSN